MGFEHFDNKMVFFMTGLTKKMSRRVRCSNGKRAGFVNANKIRCFYITSDKYKKTLFKKSKT